MQSRQHKERVPRPSWKSSPRPPSLQHAPRRKPATQGPPEAAPTPRFLDTRRLASQGVGKKKLTAMSRGDLLGRRSCTRTSSCLHVRMDTYICMRVHTQQYIHNYTYRYVHIYISLSQSPLCVYTYIYICIFGTRIAAHAPQRQDERSHEVIDSLRVARQITELITNY